MHSLSPQQMEESQPTPQKPGGRTPFLAFAIDPVSGHLYPTDAGGPIRLRDVASTDHIGPSDDTALATGTLALVGERILAYKAG